MANEIVNVRSIHSSMLQRCYNPKRPQYANYGGRGIRVCSEWHDYETFRLWAISSGYKHPLQLDRIDVNGDYEPSNCRWVTNKENCRNKRRNVLLMYNGEEKCVAEWCEQYQCLNENTMYEWIRKYGIEYAEKRMNDKINGTDKKYIHSAYSKSYCVDIIGEPKTEDAFDFGYDCIKNFISGNGKYYVRGNITCLVSKSKNKIIRAIVR